MLEYHFAVLDMTVREIPPVDAAEGWIRVITDRFALGLQDVARHEFPSPVPGNAYTICAVLSASHLVIHTAPEENWVEVVLACCKEVGMKNFLEVTKAFFRPENIRITSFTGSAPGRAVV